ncbi:MAG: N-acetyl-gamma-glutamyl-phosphate reductase [Actinomycetota bacterium]|nr:N-acetyl-gamma-glutamyl-phosphate reductase [Actinomycetota bacterium]
MGASVSVLGASGYSGGEVLRLLAGHAVFSVTTIAAGTAAGTPAETVHPHLVAHLGDVRFAPLTAAVAVETDLCISCLPGGMLRPHAGDLKARVVVDVSDDFRADDHWIYGLTELARDELRDATRIANPGCYPTAAVLAIVPFLRAGWISGPVIVDALSGVSGAGRRAEPHLGMAEMHGDVSAYGDVSHRHVSEMERALETYTGNSVTVSFTPHLIPAARGLLVTGRAALTRPASDDDVRDVLASAYSNEPFVRVTHDWPHTKWVAGSNAAVLHARVDDRAGMLVMSTAIDNLGKGAAGQAIQNANIAFGIDEATGLTATGVWP